MEPPRQHDDYVAGVSGQFGHLDANAADLVAIGHELSHSVAALAAQRADYLEKVLHAYKTHARSSPEMAAMSDVLTDEDIKNLAAHYARAKARAVVFVTVPSK